MLQSFNDFSKNFTTMKHFKIVYHTLVERLQFELLVEGKENKIHIFPSSYALRTGRWGSCRRKKMTFPSYCLLYTELYSLFGDYSMRGEEPQENS